MQHVTLEYLNIYQLQLSLWKFSLYSYNNVIQPTLHNVIMKYKFY